MINFDNYVNENKNKHNKKIGHIFQIIHTEY